MILQIVKYFLLLTTFFCFFSCSSTQKEVAVNISVSNESRTLQEIMMAIYIDNNLIIKDTIYSYKPHGKIISLHLPIGTHQLKISTLGNGLVKEDTLFIQKEDTLVGVFVSFDYYKPDSLEIKDFNDFIKTYYPPGFDTVLTGKTNRSILEW